MDMIPDGEVRFGFPNINDNVEIGEMIACGSHGVLFSIGRGSVVGSIEAPLLTPNFSRLPEHFLLAFAPRYGSHRP
jgi:hypothetical protein